MDAIIKKFTSHHNISVKVLKKNTPAMTYSDYSKRTQRFYTSLARDIKDDLEACSYDFVEDRVVLSVIPLDGGPEQLYDLFENPSPSGDQNNINGM
jgi:hypothetical protein